MAIKVKQGNTTYWRDGDGALVPVRYIPEDEKRADKYDEEWEGNATIYNFSKDKQIDIKISKHITFNEKLQIAKKKIDACLATWKKGV